MRSRAPFTAACLAELDMLLLDRATQVIAMEDVHDGNTDPRAIAMRHDVDATLPFTAHALQTAVRLAKWEAERGYRSTYYILHTARYWQAEGFADALRTIAECGHEIGIHSNALAQALRTGEDPDRILHDAIATLRGYGFRVRGVAGHGDAFCNRDRAPGEITFANDEQFLECPRPNEGEPDRTITRGAVSLKLRPRPLSDFGLEYEALRVLYPRAFRISDSAGEWLNPGWQETVERWTRERAAHPDCDRANQLVRQLQFLLHPDWWHYALTPQAVAA